MSTLVDKQFLFRAVGWRKNDFYFERMLSAIMLGKDKISMPDNDYAEACEFIQKEEQQRELLNKTVELNNTGKEYEKQGDIEKAIATYEECVALGYPAIHSYERLMIIYRKTFDYDNEIRIIKLAIKVFTKENKRRAKIAIKDHPYLKEQIENAIETCGNVRKTDGFYAYCPYPVTKYQNRLEKAIELKKKNKKS
jgi:tetratricopeptide (TPR) repeat protein